MFSEQRSTVVDSNVLKIQDVSMQTVYVEDAYMTNAFSKEIAYLLKIDDDRMLAGFRETAGIDTKGATRYEGWENMLIGGHTMGHYLTALAQSYASAGITEADKAAIGDKISYLTDSLYECQRDSKGQPGFIFGAAIVDEQNVEKQFDNVEKGRTNIITEAWVPWYTMHKILAGLVDVYRLTGNEKALEVAENLGMWVYGRTSSWSESTRNTVLSIEYGGMNDALYELYKYTGKEEFAIAAHAFDEDALFEKVNTGNSNVLDGLHANTTIPKFMGALNRYVTLQGNVIDGQTIDATKYLEYAENFFDMVLERHTYVTGGNSEWEHFGQDSVLDRERTSTNNETCNTYNMLKMARKLFEVTGKAKYLDYYEKAFINSILSSQNPETGMTMYFQPMATGYFKVYGEETTKFWCCTGTGMENFTKLGDSLYYEDSDYLYVALYFSSKVATDYGLELSMEADLKTSDTVTVSVLNTPGSGSKKLAFRIPYWIDGQLTISLNGEEIKADTESLEGFAIIDQELSKGDTITITLPMKLYASALPDDDSAMAICYGPFVLSADLGTENKKTTTTGVIVTIPENAIVSSETITIPDQMISADFAENLEDYITPVATADHTIAFKIKDCDYIFAPHYLKCNERYGIYFYYKNREQQLKDLENATGTDKKVLDTVEAGYGQYENDALHDMEDKGSYSTTSPVCSRRATAGGSFSYSMVVDPNGGNKLSVTLLAADDGKSLKITSGDAVLFEEVLDHNVLSADGSNKYTIDITIPDELSASTIEKEAYGTVYKVLPITFAAADSAESARVVEYIVMYTEK